MAWFGKKTENENKATEKKSVALVNPKSGKAVQTTSKKKPATKKLKKETGFAYRYLVRPVVSEKATYLSASGKYVFEVSGDANKRTVMIAIEKLYDVKVKSINIMKVKGKTRQVGRTVGTTPSWKKAIITLNEGEKIEVFEGI